jgi:hypothetical protein
MAKAVCGAMICTALLFFLMGKLSSVELTAEQFTENSLRR